VWGKLSDFLPERIGKYEFVRRIHAGQSDEKKAVYRDNGNEVMVKLGAGKDKLSREYENQKQFYRLFREKPEAGIVIPKPISLEEVNGEYALIMEYLSDYQGITDLEVNARVEVYARIISFLKRSTVPAGLRKISSVYQAISLPYFLLMNVLTYPSQKSVILKAFLKILINLPKWLTLSHKTLCQGDLNVMNIMVSANKLAFLDFSQACVSHEYLNPAQALNSSWRETGFGEILWGRLSGEMGFSSREKNILRSFMLYNLMQRLCKRYEDPKQEEHYFNKMKNLIRKI